MKLEYVASGMSHTRINRSINLTRAENPDDPAIAEINKCMKSLQGRHNHDFSVLFNAHTEKNLGKAINKVVKPGTLAELHADSGGLQMITLGQTPTDSLRQDVYDVQSKLSTVAMSFDEIPVQTAGDRSSRLDTAGRFFDPDALEQKAKETGQNLKKQVDRFLENKTSARPLMIVQGNCFDSYQKWTDIVLREVGYERVQHIGGVASGTAALGQGILEDFKRTFYLFNLDLPNSLKSKHFHLLGVGSIVRLTPLICMSRNGGVYDNCIVSYDSTSHTSGLSMGNYYMNLKLDKIPQFQDRQFHIVLDNINQSMKSRGLEPIEADWLYARIAKPSLWKEKYTEDHGVEEFRTIFGFMTSSVDNFMEDLYHMIQDRDFFDNFTGSRKITNQVKHFETCRDIKDFEQWQEHFGRSVQSKAVKSLHERTPDLGAFF